MNTHLLHTIILILVAAVATLIVLRRLHVPPILGYLLSGVILGPSGLGVISGSGDVQLLAELGVVFLLFTIGLELSWPRIRSMRRSVFLMGGLQVLVCTVCFALLGIFFGWPWMSAFVTAGALSLSSTAIVIKQLSEQRELHLPHGHLAFAILIFQDMAAVPLLIMIPVLGGGAEHSLAWSVSWALLKGIIAVLGMAIVGYWLVRPGFRLVAKAQSSELFMLAAILVALSAAAVTERLGLSLVLGAFVAGIMLAETEYRHQLEADIRPFRDVLLGLFFITVGALLDWNAFVSHWAMILGFVSILIVFKSLLIALVARLINMNLVKALRSGVILAHVGELGFAVLTLGISSGVLRADYGQTVLSVAVLSMFVSPLLVRFNNVWNKILPTPKHLDISQPKLVEEGLTDHVVICGYGHVGQTISRFFADEDVKILAIDNDPLIVSAASLAGESVIFGDATRKDLLLAAGVARARLVVISFINLEAAISILETLRRIDSNIPTVVRTEDKSNVKTLVAVGATDVVPEHLEKGLTLAAHVMLMLQFPAHHVIDKVEAVWRNHYSMLKSFFESDMPATEDATNGDANTLRSLVIPANSALVGQQLAALLQDHANVSAWEVRRGEEVISQPGADFIIEPFDVIVLCGTVDETTVIEQGV